MAGASDEQDMGDASVVEQCLRILAIFAGRSTCGLLQQGCPGNTQAGQFLRHHHRLRKTPLKRCATR